MDRSRRSPAARTCTVSRSAPLPRDSTGHLPRRRGCTAWSVYGRPASPVPAHSAAGVPVQHGPLVQATWSSGLRRGRWRGAEPISLEGAVAHAAAQGLVGRAADGVAGGNQQQGGAPPLRCSALVLPVVQANACRLAYGGGHSDAEGGCSGTGRGVGAVRAADGAVAGLNAGQGGLDAAWGRFRRPIWAATATVVSTWRRCSPLVVDARREATATLVCVTLSGRGPGKTATPAMCGRR